MSSTFFGERTQDAFVPVSHKAVTAHDSTAITSPRNAKASCGMLAFNVTVAGNVVLQMHNDDSAVTHALPVGRHELVGHWRLWKSTGTTATATCVAFFASA